MQIAACWKDHCEQMLTIRSTFLYLDRTYVISTSGTRSLFEMGLYAYGQHLAEHPEVMPLSLVPPGLRRMPFGPCLTALHAGAAATNSRCTSSSLPAILVESQHVGSCTEPCSDGCSRGRKVSLPCKLHHVRVHQSFVWGCHPGECLHVERRAVVGLLQQIEAERRGDTVDRVLLGHVLRSLTALGIYQTAFQTPFLQQTTEFYASEGLQLMASSDVPDYLKHAEVQTPARSSWDTMNSPEEANVCA